LVTRFRPSDEQLESGRLIYWYLSFPLDLSHEDPEWHRIVNVNRDFGLWLEEAARDAVAAYDVGLELVLVEEELRPPLASPLIPRFFIDLDPVVQAVAINLATAAAWDGFKAGFSIIREHLRNKLAERQVRPTALHVNFSPSELERLCVEYVRRCFHPRARLVSRSEGYNVRREAGYAIVIDPKQPVAWKITVQQARNEYIFIVDAEANVVSAERREGKRRLPLQVGNLLDDG
jgi:hypothetical protein